MQADGAGATRQPESIVSHPFAELAVKHFVRTSRIAEEKANSVRRTTPGAQPQCSTALTAASGIPTVSGRTDLAEELVDVDSGLRRCLIEQHAYFGRISPRILRRNLNHNNPTARLSASQDRLCSCLLCVPHKRASSVGTEHNDPELSIRPEGARSWSRAAASSIVSGLDLPLVR